MDMNKIKYGAAAVVAVAIAAGAGYWWSARVHSPPMVQVASTTCGVPAAMARFDLPLQTAVQAVGDRSIVIGPVDMPQGGGLVSLRFDRAIDGRGREVTMRDGILHLPVAFGRDSDMPERITLTCRDNRINSVRYQSARRTGSTFNVVHEEAAAMVPEVAPEEPLEAADSSLN
jgi:hypothetical protein